MTAEESLGIRDAATVIVLRDPKQRPSVLMGTRGSGAAFMPNKVVFPGGAVDMQDGALPLVAPIAEPCRERLMLEGSCPPEALVTAAIRELFEETGQMLGAAAPWQAPSSDWSAFSDAGLGPSASALRYIFRAITPPGRTRRFDARFFLVLAEHLTSDPDDFSNACDELSHLQWVPLEEVRRHDLPFITEVVLAEISQRLERGYLDEAPPSVPFFRNLNGESHFVRLGAQSPA